MNRYKIMVKILSDNCKRKLKTLQGCYVGRISKNFTSDSEIKNPSPGLSLKHTENFIAFQKSLFIDTEFEIDVQGTYKFV